MFKRTVVLVLILKIHLLSAASYEISYEPESNVSTKLGLSKELIRTGKDAISVQVAGESSDYKCDKSFLENDRGAGQVRIKPLAVDSPDTLKFSMEAEARAFRGVDLTDSCKNKNNHFPSANKEVSSSATARVNVSIKFKESVFERPFYVIVEASNKENVQISNIRGGTSEVSVESPHQIITAKSGKTYNFQVMLKAVAKDLFGNLNSNKLQSIFEVKLVPVPILHGLNLTHSPFIFNGKETEDYKQVGLILLDGKPHCTATLISSVTMITAAHCVTDEYMETKDLKNGKIKVLFSKDYRTPDQSNPAIEIIGKDFPRHAPIVFDPDSLEHDIALLYLKAAVTNPDITPSQLHSGKPSWDKIIEDKTDLTFVGYGYNPSDNKPEPGIKREAKWPVSIKKDNVVAYYNNTYGTCKCDSGGPSFYNNNGQKLLVSVTSTGADGIDTCNFGINTRIDSYLSWINQRIKK
jgi:V8-like Glu-specific endopeptidase